MRLLFICTGNVCRSPLAERLAAAWATRSLAADAARVHISSAGLDAPVGRHMDPHSAAALRELGGTPDGVRAKAFLPAMAEEADLVITMTRKQRRAVLEQSPRGLRRTFTLLEAADLIRHADLQGLDELPLEERARELGLRLDAQRATPRSVDADDIEDPIGRREHVHVRVANTIAQGLRPLALVLFSASPRLGESPVRR